jgi:hypothetical protein
MAERKQSYKTSINKKQVREFLFSQFADLHLKKIVGLAGPDINDYIKFCKSKGYDEFEIWENHTPTLIKQIREIRASKVELKYGNILDTSEDEQNVLFDLDYCATIKFMKKHLEKFNKNFIMTFSLRLGENDTISKFFKYKKEQIISTVQNFSPYFPVNHSIYKTTGGEYVYTKYYDTSTMCCFAKIN